jgi:catechol 2,3-dioxygenase-like lactoylglutathione lyase family enzyme
MSTQDETGERSSSTAPVRGLVPMIHVADVERSLEFYRLLGFEVGNYVPPDGQKHWAWLYQPKAENWKHGANLMLTRSGRALNPDAQDVLFYLYATNLVSLRGELVLKGLKAGEIRYPDYLPQGEFRMQDPDGYCLMIAQSGPDTP